MLDQLLDSSFEASFTLPLLLIVLVALEAVLSADNAIALAAIARGLENQKQQRRALNIGLIFAYVLRVALILTASWVIRFWQFEVAGALYLLWLVYRYFSSNSDGDSEHHGLKFASLWQAIPMIAVTDLAFSLDSVTTAIAISDQIWLVIVGGTIGVIALRFLAELFIRWLQEYSNLEDAGYITVGLVGVRLLIKALLPAYVPPEWLMIGIIVAIFAWGFSERSQPKTPINS
ncbi:MAG: TerC family protein [Spirulinaceae cyanobacterium]